MSKSLSTRKIVFSAVSVALATVTANYIKLPSINALFGAYFGGSTTLFSMLFVSLPGFFFGPVAGFSAAIAHGLIQLISNPYIIHPVQLLFDYILAFGALGISGLFSGKKNGLVTGYSFGCLGRFIFSTISGLIFFTEYAGVLQTDLAAVWASTAYNLSYIVPEYILTLIVISLPPVKKGLSYIKRMAND